MATALARPTGAEIIGLLVSVPGYTETEIGRVTADMIDLDISSNVIGTVNFSLAEIEYQELNTFLLTTSIDPTAMTDEETRSAWPALLWMCFYTYLENNRILECSEKDCTGKECYMHKKQLALSFIWQHLTDLGVTYPRFPFPYSTAGGSAIDICT